MHESTSAPRAHAYPPRQADLIRAAEQGPAELLRMAAAWIKPTAGIVDTRELRGVAHAAAELERFADEVEEARK